MLINNYKCIKILLLHTLKLTFLPEVIEIPRCFGHRGA